MTRLLPGDRHLVPTMSARFLPFKVTLFPAVIRKDLVGMVLQRYGNGLFLIKCLIVLISV